MSEWGEVRESKYQSDKMIMLIYLDCNEREMRCLQSGYWDQRHEFLKFFLYKKERGEEFKPHLLHRKKILRNRFWIIHKASDDDASHKIHSIIEVGQRRKDDKNFACDIKKNMLGCHFFHFLGEIFLWQLEFSSAFLF